MRHRGLPNRDMAVGLAGWPFTLTAGIPLCRVQARPCQAGQKTSGGGCLATWNAPALKFAPSWGISRGPGKRGQPLPVLYTQRGLVRSVPPVTSTRAFAVIGRKPAGSTGHTAHPPLSRAPRSKQSRATFENTRTFDHSQRVSDRPGTKVDLNPSASLHQHKFITLPTPQLTPVPPASLFLSPASRRADCPGSPGECRPTPTALWIVP